jgi:single-stranded DNA-binding protein
MMKKSTLSFFLSLLWKGNDDLLLVFVTGRLEQYRYEKDGGDTIYDNYIVVEQFDFGAKAGGDVKGG